MPIRKMRIAKASREDIYEVFHYFNKRRNAGTKIPNGAYRVCFAAEKLIDELCDPQEDHLAQSPYLFQQHVAPEQ